MEDPEDYPMTMPVFGLDDPYAMERCKAQHPELSGIMCERKAGHDPSLMHTAADDTFEFTIYWKDPK